MGKKSSKMSLTKTSKISAKNQLKSAKKSISIFAPKINTLMGNNADFGAKIQITWYINIARFARAMF